MVSATASSEKDLARGLLTRQMATAGRTRERERERLQGFLYEGCILFPLRKKEGLANAF